MDCDKEDRLHFVDPVKHNEKFDDLCFEYDDVDSHGVPIPGTEKQGSWCYTDGKRWKPDWSSFMEEI